MIRWGFGKVTRKFLGTVFVKECSYCNQITSWQLCITRTWFTLFFIPIIPYKTEKCVMCPNCGSYIKIDNEKFNEIKNKLNSTNESEILDAYKYAGKTETQINFLKEMEKAKENAN